MDFIFMLTRNDVTVPRIYWQRSSRRVLTMDYLDGIKITDVAALRAAGMDTAAIADSLTDIFNVMVLRHGLFHADPHPGNLLVLPAIGGGPPRIGLVDFGLTKRLPEAFRQQVVVLTSAIIAQHRGDVSTAMEDMGFRTEVPDEETYYEIGEAFLGEVLRSGQAYADQRLFAEVNVRLSRVLRANPLVEVPGDVVLVARVMGLLSGLGRALNSETDLIESLVPFLEEESAREAS